MASNNSKLGLHLQKRRHGWPQVVADTTPALVKSLEWGIIDDWISAEQSDPIKIEHAHRWQSQHTFLLGRHVTSLTPENPAQSATAFWDEMLDQLTGGDINKRGQVLGRMRRFDAWEGLNEIGTGAAIYALGQFDAALARIMHSHGLRYAGGGFAMTQPTPSDWGVYCDALLDAVSQGQGELPDFLHFHEYWYPDTSWPELLDAKGAIDADKMREATRGCMLHWRDLYACADTPRAMRLPVIISECGWDQHRPAQVGFRASELSDADYAAWLIWYDQELQRLLHDTDYVVGAAVFTYGHEARWESFEVDQVQGRGVLSDLMAYLRLANKEPHPQRWRAIWEASPGHGQLPDGETHYVLFGPRITSAWRHALDSYLGTFQATNGQSVLDATRMAGVEHHITLVGAADAELGVPSAWEREIRYRQPSVAMDRMHASSVWALRQIVARRVRHGDRYGQQDDQPILPRPRSLRRKKG